jgi:hypothetical protein
LIGADEEEVSEMPQHGRTPMVRAVRNRAVELVDEFEWSAHKPCKTVLVGSELAISAG